MIQNQSDQPLACGHADKRLQASGWLRLWARQGEQLAGAQREHGLDLSPGRGRAAIEEGDFIVIPVEMVIRAADQYLETTVVFALGKHVLISVEQDVRLGALDQASEQLLETLEAGGTLDPMAMMFTLLEALNDSAHAAIREISARLDEHSEAVAAASGGFEMSKCQAGVADIASTAIALGEAEELVAKAVEGQLMLARAGRWLRRFTSDARLQQSLPTLLSDIHSLRRYARFQHDKIRNLQQSLMTTLDIKQNQVIKVFTVITAVFTPPTLVGAFYGQNFAYMPELQLPWGEWIVMLLTGLFALVPLAYIKRKGWMR
ncbi:Magnesium transport protein CorA [Pseudomonas reidholzensis]|uniref:Magnesium transport protein CorA n=1 Tax=Pseudomonas reidholzensis TaxID=1785162 RepID=A0A383RYV2_9PSED|nr:CorA family divalent cation transporter [Pseudomonas reidholzensis]SYX91611.1 Magnesium transport protein CorA [Pseudomonas reidholzensis]